MASQKVHGITIDLDVNASGVTQSFAEINKSIRSTQSELKTVDKLLKIDPSNTTLLAQKQVLLSNAIDDTKSKLVALAKAKMQADNSDDVDKNSKAYRELERDIESTKNALDKLTKEEEDNNSTLKKSKSGISDLTSGFKDASSKALSFGDVLKANVFSDIIINGAKSLANAVLDMAKGMYNSVRDAGKLADDINTLAKQYNLTTKEIQQYMKASDLVDVSLETIAKSMTKLTKNMNEPSKSVAEAFNKLGIATRDSNGALLDSNEVFNKTIEQLALVKNETEQDALAMEIFGKSASDLGPLINGGAEELKKLNEYLEVNGLLLSDDELSGLNQMNDSFDYLKISIDSLIQKLATELSPLITPIIDKINQFVLDNKDKIVEWVEQIIEDVTGPDGEKLFDLVDGLIENIQKFIDDLPVILDGIKDVIDGLTPLSKLLGGIVGLLREMGELLSGTYDASQVIGTDADPYHRRGYYSGGYGDSTLMSGGYNSGGITLHNTINVNNNGKDITDYQVAQWGRKIASVVDQELGRYM